MEEQPSHEKDFTELWRRILLDFKAILALC
jgi:hypothetical protein